MSEQPISSYLTGRRRYRKCAHQRRNQWMILQVEKSIWRDHKWVCEWFDATPDDVNKDELV